MSEEKKKWEKVNINEDRVENGNYSVVFRPRWGYECPVCGCVTESSELPVTFCPYCGNGWG